MTLPRHPFAPPDPVAAAGEARVFAENGLRMLDEGLTEQAALLFLRAATFLSEVP